MVDHVHAEAHRAASDRLTDATHAQDAQRAAAYIHAQPAGELGGVPVAGAQPALGSADAPRRAEQHRPGEVGHALVQHVGGVGDGNARRSECSNIEIVVTHGKVGDDAQPRRAGDFRSADVFLQADDGGILIQKPGRQLGR